MSALNATTRGAEIGNGANLFAGAGFTLIGLAALGAPFFPTTGLHILSIDIIVEGFNSHFSARCK